MNHGSLFSGIGGFDLAAECPEGVEFPSMGWKNMFHCEINPWSRRLLNYYWPKSKSYEDIKQTDFSIWRGRVDILTGGFPCQPYSQAGKRKGKEDERHLWPEMLRAIREIQPRWIVGENVLGIVSWDAGLVFEEVQADLEAEGYSVQPFVLPAAGVNAPHQRYRVWFVAHAEHNGDSRRTKEIQRKTSQKDSRWEKWEVPARQSIQQPDKPNTIRPKDGEISSNTNRHKRSKRRLHSAKQEAAERHTRPLNSRHDWGTWENFPTQSPICSGNDGIPEQLDGITFPKWRNESIKGYGNAIVPQVALQIFKAIEAYERI